MFSVKKILRTLPYLLSSCVNRGEDIGIQKRWEQLAADANLPFTTWIQSKTKQTVGTLELNCLLPPIQASCPLTCSKYKCWWNCSPNGLIPGDQEWKKKILFLKWLLRIRHFLCDSPLQPHEVSNILYPFCSGGNQSLKGSTASPRPIG